MILTKGKFKGREFSTTPTCYQDWLNKQPFFDSMFEAKSTPARPVNTSALRGWDGHARKGQAAYDALFQREMDEADDFDHSDRYSDKRLAEDVVVGYCAARGLKITRKDLRDWNITGEESNDQLRQYANDLCNEEHTAKNEAKNAWRYQH